MSKPSYPNVEDEVGRVPPDETLLIEYQEAGAEWRNYEKLLNQSYYLSAIVFTFFAGALTNLVYREAYGLTALLSFTAFVVFVVLGQAGRAYNDRRDSASRLRTQIAEELHELTNSRTPRIQKVIVGDGEVRIDEREDDSPSTLWEWFTLWKPTLAVSIGWLSVSIIFAYLWYI